MLKTPELPERCMRCGEFANGCKYCTDDHNHPLITPCKVCGGVPDKPKSQTWSRTRNSDTIIVPWHEENAKCNALWCTPCVDMCHVEMYTEPKSIVEEPFQIARLIRELMMREDAR